MTMELGWLHRFNLASSTYQSFNHLPVTQPGKHELTNNTLPPLPGPFRLYSSGSIHQSMARTDPRTRHAGPDSRPGCDADPAELLLLLFVATMMAIAFISVGNPSCPRNSTMLSPVPSQPLLCLC
ncbi:uncharacterized protein BO88DRAFT_85525 [Aspergillus vadensis CBS 113365]|uniref:Uncharacterized protein n=1 Tax=Aspergillus vadensis (strain CBS 113365 / IMI 142717 / IBT 24658) TaxID=1448311 RepID=A0A319B367_ASPVC|nr:hypothetical protein BO88DRAFT_85525 [Aspergillus vadensis CBS 113365]PYH67206.1 hypothetical protein BO88DRAFT_85525 [Aspergillus vadensis CBS 113365]